MIARVSPEHKVRLVDVLRKEGQIVAMTGDGVNDAPAVKKADIGIAMGTGTEVTQEAAVMILTDDNFSTIVKAVELGRGLYDNLTRYIRFQMGGLFAYIATFLGASIFNIAEGIQLLPLQTLWVSFTMLSIQSVGLGYSKPAAGLMDRPPLPPSQPILTRGILSWLAFAGLLMAAGTLSVISWADQAHGLAIARTMGMVTFALFILFFSIESKDERDSAFSLDTFSDKTFRITTSGSFVLLVLSTVLGIFQTVMHTTRLDVRQWLICTAVALLVVVAAEIRKAVRRRAAARAIRPADAPQAGATTPERRVPAMRYVYPAARLLMVPARESGSQHSHGQAQRFGRSQRVIESPSATRARSRRSARQSWRVGLGRCRA